MSRVEQQGAGQPSSAGASPRVVQGISSRGVLGAALLGSVLLVGFVSCGVDERAVAVNMDPTRQVVADLGACEPGAAPSSCDGGLVRVCTNDGRWVLISCEQAGAGTGGGNGKGRAGVGGSGGAGAATGNPISSPAPAAVPAPPAAAAGMQGAGGAAGAGMLPGGGAAGSAMAGGAGGGAGSGMVSEAGGAAGSAMASGAGGVGSMPPMNSAGPADVVVGDCRFEYLGEWVRCENAGAPNVLETDAPDLVSCMQQCLTRADCTAVTDYFWLGLPDLGCYLYLSTCAAPSVPVWGEEDGGRDFRRACAGAP